MSWRCAFLYSLPIILIYIVSFFLPAWQDGNATYVGYETLGKGFDFVGKSGDYTTVLLLLLPNVLFCTGVMLLAVPKTWARIVAAVLGFIALLLSTQIMICIGFLAFLGDIASNIFGASSGPSGVREGFFFWIGSMFLLMMTGMITAIVSGTRARPNRRDDGHHDDEPFSRRRRSEGERYRRDPD